MGALYNTVAYTTTGTKASLNLDPSIADFKVTVATTVGTTATYKMEYSLDPMTVADSDALWFENATIPAGTTTSKVALITTPIARVRLVIAAVSGTLTIQVRQGISVN